jgi:DNA-directed RNA polymerase specialized sigma24 family protein
MAAMKDLLIRILELYETGYSAGEIADMVQAPVSVVEDTIRVWA